MVFEKALDVECCIISSHTIGKSSSKQAPNHTFPRPPDFKITKRRENVTREDQADQHPSAAR
jgi:hypothetical protein